jgi:hypothetical protein
MFWQIGGGNEIIFYLCTVKSIVRLKDVAESAAYFYAT